MLEIRWHGRGGNGSFTAAKLRRMLSVEGFDWERMGATDLIEAGHPLADILHSRHFHHPFFFQKSPIA